MSEATTLSAIDICQRTERPTWALQCRLLLCHALELTVMGYVLLGLCATLHGPISGSGLWDFFRASRQPAPWQALWGFPASVLLTVLAGYALRRPFGALGACSAKLLERPFTLLVTFLVVAGGLYDAYVWSGALHLKMPLWLRAPLGIWGGNDAIIIDYGAAPILMVILITARFFRRPVPLALFLFTLFAAAFGLIFYYKSWSVIAQITRDFNSAPSVIHSSLRPGLMVSVIFMPLGSALKILTPLLAALYAVRRGFAWWNYLLGWVAGFFLASLILLQSLPSILDVRFVLLGWLWLFLLARLPFSRRNLETLLGLPLCAEEVPVATPQSTPFAFIVGHAMAAVLGLLLLAFGVIGHYQKKMVDLIERGAEPPQFSPALVNAYDALKTHFGKNNTSSALSPTRYGEPPEFALMEQLAALPRPLFEEAWAIMTQEASSGVELKMRTTPVPGP